MQTYFQKSIFTFNDSFNSVYKIEIVLVLILSELFYSQHICHQHICHFCNGASCNKMCEWAVAHSPFQYFYLIRGTSI